MIDLFVVAEPKWLLLADQNLSAVINTKNCPIFVQKAAALAHRPEHRLSLDLTPPYFPILSLNFLGPVVLIPHVLHMLEQFLLNPRGRIGQEVRRFGLHSTMFISFYLLDLCLPLLDMNIRRIGAWLSDDYMVFTPLAGVKSA